LKKEGSIKKRKIIQKKENQKKVLLKKEIRIKTKKSIKKEKNEQTKKRWTKETSIK
jgi:hypothetical protein